MDTHHGENHYRSKFVEDRKDGYAGLRLTRIRSITGDQLDVAQVTFWDAAGQFYFETFGEEVPVAIVRELLAEVEALIKTT